MPTADAKNIGRLIRAATAALALALLLSRVTAGPAGAEPQGPGTVNANAFIDWCVANGGSPDADYDGSYGKIVGVCWFSDGSKLQCNFWLDGSTDCYAVSPNGNWHLVNPPDGTGIAPPLILPPAGYGQPGGNGAASGGFGGALDGGGTGNGGTMTFTGGQSGGTAFLLTTPAAGGTGHGTAAPSDPTPPGSAHAPKPHKGHKPGQGAPLAGTAKAAHHGKGKPSHHKSGVK
jgi:hypothetical protein